MLDQDLFRFASIFLYPNFNKENENHLLLPISRDKNGSIKFDEKRTTSKLKKIHEAEENLNNDPLIFKFIEDKFDTNPESFQKSLDLILQGVDQKFISYLFSAQYGNNKDDLMGENIFHRIINLVDEEMINHELLNEIKKDRFYSQKDSISLEKELEYNIEHIKSNKKLENISENIKYLINISSVELLDETNNNGMKPYELALKNNNFFLAQELKSYRNFIIDPNINIEYIYLRKNNLNQLNEKISKQEYLNKKIDQDLQEIINDEFKLNDELEKKYFGEYDFLSNFIENLPLILLNNSDEKEIITYNINLEIIKENLKALKRYNKNSNKDFTNILEEKIQYDFENTKINELTQRFINEIKEIIKTND